MSEPSPHAASRAIGCLLGQLSGDSLGSLVEFRDTADIRREYPQGLRQMAHGGTWGLLPGQPTDDSELALMLARLLAREKDYQPARALDSYRFWYQSDPFDCGETTRRALTGDPNPASQSNGSLMRISPLGIFGSRHPLSQVCQWAMADARLTHPHPVCQHSAALYAMAIARAIASPITPGELYDFFLEQALALDVEETVMTTLRQARDTPPEDYMVHQGWVLTALHNALWQLLHAPDLTEGVCDTVMRGGDTDTNAAICGALLGAVYGEEAIPAPWRQALLNCRPEAGRPRVHRPRPTCFWPVDAPRLALQLLEG